jgi:hypothetical protein
MGVEAVEKSEAQAESVRESNPKPERVKTRTLQKP